MTDRPDPAEVLADAIGGTTHLVAALRSAGFMLLHESDRDRLVEAVYRNVVRECENEMGRLWSVLAVAAIYELLEEQ